MEVICLDTNVLIDLLRGDFKAVEEIKQLENQFELATTAINLFELYYGAYKTGRDKNVEAVNELGRRIEVLKFTHKSAEISGRILSELEKKGKTVDFRDVMIAGIVIENDVTLYTRNLKHFKRIDGIKLYRFDL